MMTPPPDDILDLLTAYALAAGRAARHRWHASLWVARRSSPCRSACARACACDRIGQATGDSTACAALANRLAGRPERPGCCGLACYCAPGAAAQRQER